MSNVLPPVGALQLLRVSTKTRHTFAVHPDGARQLYDLGADPHELFNLAGQPAHRALERRLQAVLEERASSF